MQRCMLFLIKYKYRWNKLKLINLHFNYVTLYVVQSGLYSVISLLRIFFNFFLLSKNCIEIDAKWQQVIVNYFNLKRARNAIDVRLQSNDLRFILVCIRLNLFYRLQTNHISFHSNLILFLCAIFLFIGVNVCVCVFGVQFKYMCQAWPMPLNRWKSRKMKWTKDQERKSK